MCAPAFFTPRSDQLKVVFYLIELYVLIVIVGWVLTVLYGTSNYVFTDSKLTPYDVPYYHLILSNDQLSSTAKYGFHYWIITSDFYTIPIYTIPILMNAISFQKPFSYGVIIIVFIGVGLLVDLAKTVYYTSIYLFDCDNFWFCRSIDVLNPKANPSPQFLIIFLATVGRTLFALVNILLEWGLLKSGQFASNLQDQFEVEAY